ncbi:MAG: methyl-accepting chemotaxis protein [Candidatus Tectimicrobiota bacterium]
MRLPVPHIALTIRAKVIVLVLLSISAMGVGTGLAVWIARDSKSAVEAIYRETIVPLEQLQRVESFIREVELRMPGVIADMFSGKGSKAYIESALPEVLQAWEAFKAARQTGQTAALHEEFEVAFQAFQAKLPALGEALAREHKKTLNALADEWLDLKPKLFKPLNALLGAGREHVAWQVKAMEEQLHRTVWTIVIGLTIFLGLILLLSLALVRGISVSLRQTMRFLQELATGEGNLSRRLQVTHADEMGELARWFNAFIDKLHEIISHVQQSSSHVTAVSSHLASAAQQLSACTQAQASSLEETTARLGGLSGTVRQNADHAQQAQQLALEARHTAQQGSEVVAAAVASMDVLNSSSRRIASIIGSIDDIAFQTNLLALNAAVEAARAGEQGRGFAVVAAEVGHLAKRSATAAKEIKTLIQDSGQHVKTSTAMVGQSGQTLTDIVTSAAHVTDIIAAITTASQEQAQGIEQVSQAVTHMDQIVRASTTQAENLSCTSQDLATQAAALQNLVNLFKLHDHQDIAPEALGAQASPASPPSPGVAARARLQAA